MGKKVALVAGASGVVGSRVVELLSASSEWKAVACSRRPPPLESHHAGANYVSVDLIDTESCRRLARDLDGVTHLFYAARHEFTTGEHEASARNTLMFRNILDALEETDHPLEHVHMVHGTKYYGSTLGPFQTPARETDPRGLLSNFYYEQEDLVAARSGTRRWSWSISRPHGVCDSSLATPRSMPLLIAAYASICQHLGQPLCFPGTRENYRAIYQCTDARLLAQAIVWMASEPQCADQAFNVTNGDFFRWERLWPAFADYFGLDSGPVRTIRLAEIMPDKGKIWNEVIARHNLAATPFERMALWSYGDFIFTPGWDMMSSTTKLRQYGFHGFADSEEMFFRYFDSFRAASIIPPAA